MKKLIITMLAISCWTYAGAQDNNTLKDGTAIEKPTMQCRTLTAPKSGGVVSLYQDVKIQITDKLEIEADSAVYDRDKKLIITYGTNKFSFFGTVTMEGNKNNKICKYYLNSNTMAIE